MRPLNPTIILNNIQHIYHMLCEGMYIFYETPTDQIEYLDIVAAKMPESGRDLYADWVCMQSIEKDL